MYLAQTCVHVNDIPCSVITGGSMHIQGEMAPNPSSAGSIKVLATVRMSLMDQVNRINDSSMNLVYPKTKSE